MPGAAPNSDRATWFLDANSLLVSAVCHLAALATLGLVTMAIDPGFGRVLLATVSDVPAEPLDRDVWLDLDAPSTVAIDGAAEAIGPAKLFDVSSLATSDSAPHSIPLEITTVASGLDGHSLGKFGTASGLLSGTSKFFGVSGYGQSFVYVVDCSGSMGEEAKFLRARKELLYSLQSLEADQKYYVIFYSDAAYPMDAEAPIFASQAHLDQTRQWVDYIVPQGGTNPLPALLSALSLKPDAIYFLSDGKFDPSTITQVRAKNRPRQGHRIPIHSIAFVNRESQRLMRSIAVSSGGEFRFVP